MWLPVWQCPGITREEHWLFRADNFQGLVYVSSLKTTPPGKHWREKKVPVFKLDVIDQARILKTVLVMFEDSEHLQGCICRLGLS